MNSIVPLFDRVVGGTPLAPVVRSDESGAPPQQHSDDINESSRTLELDAQTRVASAAVHRTTFGTQISDCFYKQDGSGQWESLPTMLYNVLFVVLSWMYLVAPRKRHIAESYPESPAMSPSEAEDDSQIVTRALSESSEESDSSSGGAGLRRSTRIRLYNDDKQVAATAEALKSPSRPRAPRVSSQHQHTVPLHHHAAHDVVRLPRPLLPLHPQRKTLILDLDETLIHSLAKGSKMSAGHMVEIKFEKHAILYYVHKRPHCDRFLKKVNNSTL
jgi:hypothetical protein